ncbi:MAG: hypothetical protein WCJ72_15370 [Chryseobacterium sp.]
MNFFISKKTITPSSVKCLSFLLIQQLIVASSIYFLTQAAKLYSEGRKSESLLFFLGYSASLVLPFFPGSISFYFSRKWKFEIVQGLCEKYVQEFSGQTSVWLNKKSKEEIVSLLNTELILSTKNLVDSVYSFASTALNVSFTAIGLTIFLDNGFLPVYAFSLFISSLIYRASINNITLSEIESQKNRTSLSELLRRSWDALLLKNFGNFLDWQKSSENSLKNYLASEEKAEKAKVFSNLSLSMSSFLPVLAYVGWQAFSHLNDTQKILSILVNMPRVFMLMNHTYAILCDTIEIKSVGTLWNRLVSRLDSTIHIEKTAFSKIQSSLISVNSKDGNSISLDEFMLLPHEKLKGIYTVRGLNGSGKSLSLLKLKEKYSDAAYLLPAHHDLFVNFQTQLSSGQLARKSIEWIKENTESLSKSVRVLLLDEWNANLDSDNLGALEKVLLELSENFLIVEVRHDPKIC